MKHSKGGDLYNSFVSGKSSDDEGGSQVTEERQEPDKSNGATTVSSSPVSVL